MEDTRYFEEVEKYINSYKLQTEGEKKNIAECQKQFSNLVNSFIQKAPSNSVINSLFKDEPEGFVFSKYDEKRKLLAEQRRAEYNAFLEKKEAERLSKQRSNEEKNLSPKSILDSVDYERVLAKRKEEEAKFRNANIADILHNSKPILKKNIKKPDFNVLNSSDHTPSVSWNNNDSLSAVNLSGSILSSREDNQKFPVLENKKNSETLNRENSQLLEERIAKHLEEQKRQMLLEFEKELRKDNKFIGETRNLKSSNSVRSLPQRADTQSAGDFDYSRLGRTGGGGEPVRDSYGNLITMRGSRRQISSDSALMSFPSMQQQPVKDRMALYREELQRQIEEKKRLEALEKAKLKEQEERHAQRIEEQRLKMLEEYENEMKKNNKIKEEFQRQQERIRKLEEFQRKDAEARRKKFAEMKAPEPVKPQPAVINERSNSPPIPAVRTKVLFEKSVPPVIAAPEVKPGNVFSSLAEIRRKIKEEQQKPRKEKSYEVMNRRTVQEVSDDDDDDDVFKSSTNSYTQYSA